MAVLAKKSMTRKTAIGQSRPAKKAKTTRRSTSSALKGAQTPAQRKRGRPTGSGRAVSTGHESDPLLATQLEAINNEIAALRREVQGLGSSIDVLGQAVERLLGGRVPLGQEKSTAESPSSPGTVHPNANSGSYWASGGSR